MCESNRFSCIKGFGEELNVVCYGGLSNWLISFRDISSLYQAHFSYLLLSYGVCLAGYFSFRHAQRNGGALLQYWLGALAHGVVSETRLISTKLWYAQNNFMFFGRTLPLHMVLYYPFVFYLSALVADRFPFQSFTEPAAVGLMALLLGLPFHILQARFLHVTYHDSEPSYRARFFGVPWVEIAASVMQASSYCALFHGLKEYFLNSYRRWQPSNMQKEESVLTAAAAVCSPLLGVVQRTLWYHILQDVCKVSPTICVLMIVSCFVSILLFDLAVGSRAPGSLPDNNEDKTFLKFQLCAYVLPMLVLCLVGNPQDEVSIGKHEQTGDCTTMVCSRTPLFMSQMRRKYLCADEVADRKNFIYNFQCVPNGPPCLNARWYTICGGCIKNRFEFFVAIFSFLLLALTLVSIALFKSEVASTFTQMWQSIKRTLNMA